MLRGRQEEELLMKDCIQLFVVVSCGGRKAKTCIGNNFHRKKMDLAYVTPESTAGAVYLASLA